MIVLVRNLSGGWRWYAGNGAGDRDEPREAFEDALYAYRASIAQPTYGKCKGDDAGCWCGRPGHVEINATAEEVKSALGHVWQGSNDGVTWATMPGAGPLLVVASHRYAREVDSEGAVLRYGEHAKPPGAPRSKYGE